MLTSSLISPLVDADALSLVSNYDPSLEIAGFCIYISDLSILCIHILIQLTKLITTKVTSYFL